jgi:RNA polymerase sigma factor (sigma-70 family)
MCIVHPLDVESPAAFACAQTGCAVCLEALLKRHEKLVRAVLRRQWRGEVVCADLVQEGRIGLWQAVLHYDPQRGVAFSTYAWHAIARRMWRVVFVENRRREAEQAWTRTRAGYTWSEQPNPLHMAEDVLWWETVCATLAESVSATCCVSEPRHPSVDCPKHDQLTVLLQVLSFYSLTLAPVSSPPPTCCRDPRSVQLGKVGFPLYNLGVCNRVIKRRGAHLSVQTQANTMVKPPRVST